MNQYYCHECAILTNLYTPIEPINVTGTVYQCGKFMKHTMPTGTFPGKNSLFRDPTYQAYYNYIVTGTASGMIEIDYKHRKNLIWYAGSQIGVEIINGIFNAPTDGVKIVKLEDDQSLHAYPIIGIPGLIQYCANCGKPLPQW